MRAAIEALMEVGANVGATDIEIVKVATATAAAAPLQSMRNRSAAWQKPRGC